MSQDINKLTNKKNDLLKFKALSEATNEAIFFTDEGFCIECNQAALKMFGYSYDEIIGLFATDIISSDWQELVKTNIIAEYPHPYTVQAKRKDNSFFWVEIQARMMRYQDRKIRVSTLRDISAQKEAEAVAVSNDLKYQLLFESMSESFVMHRIIRDKEGTIIDLIFVDANSAYLKLANIQKEELVGQSVKNSWKSLTPERWNEYNSLTPGESAVQYDFYDEKSDKYFEVKAYIAQENYLAQTISDVTEKKKAALEMESHNKRLELLVFFSEIAVESYFQLIETILLESAKLLNSSLAYCFVQSENSEQIHIIQNPPKQKDDRLINWYQLLPAAQKQKAEIIEVEVGKENECLLSIPIYRNHQIKLHYFFEVAKENNTKQALDSGKILLESSYSIIERQKYEEQIIAQKEKAKLSEYRFAEIQKAGKIGWYEALIKEGTFLGSYETYNIFFDEYRGVPATSEDLITAIHPEDRDLFFKTVQENIEKKSKSFDWEYRVISPKTGIKHVFSRAYLEFDNNGKLLRRFGIVQDITKIKKYEEQLIQSKEKAIESDRLKSAFLANMSHEIRTPMNGIIGFSELFMYEDIPYEKKVGYAKIVIESGKHLLNIVDDILDISKIEVGQLNVVFVPVCVNEILTEVYDIHLQEHSGDGIQLNLEKELLDNDSTIYTDKFRLVQILNNLLGNAFKFTKHGSINFGYKRIDNSLEFYVKDTGVGIPKDLHEAVFDRFRQADQEIARQVGGTGLGLAITEKLVGLLGGDIRLESKPDEGSTFYFTLPFEKEHKINEAIMVEEAVDKKRATILIAEDEEINFLFLKELLKKEPFEIIHAVNGQEALDTCKVNPQIDLVLMDVKMPIMNGLQATIAIKEFRPTLPIIMQTAFSMESDKRNAFAAGCTGFLPKPLIKQDLLDIINQSLGKENT